MQRTDIVALVAGTTVGMGGAFLICTAGRALTLHLLPPYYDLGKQSPLTPRPGTRQTSLASTLETRLSSNKFLNDCPEHVARVDQMPTPAE